ncbi:MAG: DEAD/DEAH box helicase [Gammaproteobacteria bacterium]|nr:DEAD/DEAH box helicase [Gammaproteobacteria bacterium]
MSSETAPAPAFVDFALGEPLQKALRDVGYETPSPIQARTIPLLLEGRDLVGQAQTGTGKTAAFALPMLARIDLKSSATQVLVLAPTRELAIQVAEAFQRYATHMKGFHVLPIYGGQDYGTQLRALKRGAQVVVGTPGRVMDHMRKGTLNLDSLQALVLDEADEMLRMGFIDDVEWVLSQTPPTRQVALFSATMPDAIRRIAKQHLDKPEEVTVKQQKATASLIRQRFWMVSGFHKLDALTRILEFETFDGMIIFVRTKNATTELAEKLQARGYAVEALSGDIAQAQRERTVDRLKKGKIDILVATDVVARGLDVDRISHIINYDIPYDTESYVHRIGRTGRAGRTGDAILFVAPRERRLLQAIERATGQRIEPMELPSTEIINDQRIARFKQRITDTLATEEIGFFYQLIEQYQQEHNVPAMEVAAALAVLLQGDQPLLLEKARTPVVREGREPAGKPRREREERPERGVRPERAERAPGKRRREAGEGEAVDMERFRIEVGRDHGVQPGNIVGAIANEAGLDSQYIGRIDIQEDHSLVDLPAGMPEDIFTILRATRVAGRPLQISKLGGERPVTRRKEAGDDKPKRNFKPRPAAPGAKAKPGGKPKVKTAAAKNKGKPKAPRKP